MMTDAEYQRIRSAFDECNRRLQQKDREIADIRGICATLTEQVQRLKDAVAIAISRK
jgi:hypothetical protein